MQKLLPVGWRGQLSVPQLPLLHPTSHRHELAHATSAHAPLVLQLTSQRPLPHVIVPHAPVAVHAIVHDSAREQSIVPHSPATSHRTSQCMPAGHATFGLAGSAIVHCGGSLVTLHDLHALGHVFGSSTHRPCSHTRPPLQSLDVAHGIVRRSIVHEPMAIAVTTPSAAAAASARGASALTIARRARAPRRDR